VAALHVALPTSPAHASPPTDLVIVSPIDIPSGTGSFEVSEDEGDLLCDEGSVENRFTQFVGGQSGSHGQILLLHEFTCDDGSGSFALLLRVNLDFTTFNTTGSWSVLEGTGDYTKLHGSGSIAGSPCGPDCVLDTYTGRVHID
jgi:hypothetical protein